MEEQVYRVIERQSKDSTDLAVYEVTKVVAYNGGFAIDYIGRDKLKDVVYVPKNYPFVQRNGYTCVGKVSGNNSAAPVSFGVAVGGSVDVNCPGEDLSMLIRTDCMARGYRTMYAKNINWKLLLIIGGVVIAAIVVITIIRGGGVPGAGA